MEPTELRVDISFFSPETDCFLKTLTTSMGMEGALETIKSDMSPLKIKILRLGHQSLVAGQLLSQAPFC